MIDFILKVIAAIILGFLFFGVSAILIEIFSLHNFALPIKGFLTLFGGGLGLKFGAKFIEWLVGGISF